MKIDIKLFIYGIIALAAIALFLEYSATNQQIMTGSEIWGSFASGMHGLVMIVTVLFFGYLFGKLIVQLAGRIR